VLYLLMNTQLLTVGLVVVSILATPPLMAKEADASQTNFVAVLSGGEEVPAVEMKSRGVASFQLSPDGTELSYRLIVANINEVSAAHIHLAPSGVNGPVVAFLFNGPIVESANGVLAQGTITADDLTGPLAGQSLADLVAEIQSGNTYVNVHTSANPGGEIRGQIR
jgi:hypothetical protein